ncbi:hypothetical protein [Flavobacterium sp. JP2137]|uniref:hypothetical protein n=1 Tax=Flavobacterium sp. JP2137 TaxID=3414510 RepID=UPI003D3008BB
MNKKFYIICLLVLLGSLLLSSIAFAHSKPHSLLVEKTATAAIQHHQLSDDCCKQGDLKSCTAQKDHSCSDYQCQCLSNCIPVVAFIPAITYVSLITESTYKPQFKAISALISDGFIAIWVPPLLG